MDLKRGESKLDMVLLRNEEQTKTRMLEAVRADATMTQVRASTVLDYWRAIYKGSDDIEYRATADELTKTLEKDIATVRALQQSLLMRQEVEGAQEQLQVTQQLLRFLTTILDKLKKRRHELAEEAFRNWLMSLSAFGRAKVEANEKDKDKSKEAQKEGRAPAATKQPERQPGAKGMTK